MSYSCGFVLKIRKVIRKIVIVKDVLGSRLENYSPTKDSNNKINDSNRKNPARKRFFQYFQCEEFMQP